MYPINPLNPAIYPEDKRYMCGHWLVEYETLHHGERVCQCSISYTQQPSREVGQKVWMYIYTTKKLAKLCLKCKKDDSTVSQILQAAPS